MELDPFAVSVAAICAGDRRFDAGAYLFVREALVFTARQQKKKPATGVPAPESHVTGQQLLEGVRHYALDQFGPMVPTVFAHWGISSCADIGAIVFNLIAVGEFGKTDQDTIADFHGGFDFQEAFVAPFQPLKKKLVPAAAAPTRRPPGARADRARPRRSRSEG